MIKVLLHLFSDGEYVIPLFMYLQFLSPFPSSLMQFFPLHLQKGFPASHRGNNPLAGRPVAIRCFLRAHKYRPFLTSGNRRALGYLPSKEYPSLFSLKSPRLFNLSSEEDREEILPFFSLKPFPQDHVLLLAVSMGW